MNIQDLKPSTEHVTLETFLILAKNYGACSVVVSIYDEQIGESHYYNMSIGYLLDIIDKSKKYQELEEIGK